MPFEGYRKADVSPRPHENDFDTPALKGSEEIYDNEYVMHVWRQKERAGDGRNAVKN